MNTVNLIQGTEAWRAHRATHRNASDTPIVMGLSPYKTREDFLRERATGIEPDVDEHTQRRFDDGHRFEQLARPVAEGIVGERLYPCVGVNGEWSASFDGLTMDFATGFEHKTLGAELQSFRQRMEDGEPITGADLPEHYRVQMEHQCMVSGAERVLFMATRWDNDVLQEQMWCWYTPDSDLRARMMAGWAQFERDLADYRPETETPKPIAAPVEGFGVLVLRVEGRVLASNLDAFKASAYAFLERLPKPSDLQTDQDFADADQAAKACSEAEDRIEAAVNLALAQMSDIDAVLRAAKAISETIRTARIALSKAVASEKEARKAALVRTGVDAVRAHYAEINATLGEHAIGVPAGIVADIGASIKGLKTLVSMRDKINVAVAAAKIDASQRAERVRQCFSVLAEHLEHAHLFPDRVALCANKQPDDLRNLVAARIAEYRSVEERRAAERAAADERRVREAEERGRQMAEIAAQRQTEVATKHQAVADVEDGIAHFVPAEPALRTDALIGTGKTPVAGEMVTLSQINTAIAPMSIDAEGLASLGFPVAARDRSRKLYDASSFAAMVDAMRQKLVAARLVSQDAKAA